MEEEMKRPARGIDPAGLGERAILEEPRFDRHTKGTSSETQDADCSTENGHYVPAYVNGLNAHDAFQFLYLKVPPQELIVSPFLPSKGVVMLYAPRGIGKTHVALAIAVAAASGTAFLRWQASHQWRVVYIDGEMPATLMQERFSRHIKSNEIEFPPENLRFVLADLEPDGLPDLGDPNAQPFYDGVIRDADLIVIDNLSTICRSCRENEADSWGPVQEWLLQRRREGKSVLVVHHSGKNGGQRGTSRREDIMSSVIALRRPPDYQASQGARFEVHYEKARGFFGEDAEPFEAWLQADKWTVGEISREDEAEVLKGWRGQGLSTREIAKASGMSKSTVARKLKELPQ